MKLSDRPRQAGILAGIGAALLSSALWLWLSSHHPDLEAIVIGVLVGASTILSATLALAVYFAIRSGIESRTLATAIALREQTDLALRESEAKMRALLDGAPDAIISVDRHGSILMVNAVTEGMFGYRRDQLVGQAIEILVPEPHRGKHVEDRRIYVEAPRTRPMGIGLPLSGRRRDGSEFPVEISLSPIPSVGGVEVICVVRDVRERKEAERRASTMVRALATIGESATVLAHEIKNPLTAVNAALKALASKLGLEDQEVLSDLVERMRRIEAMIRRTLSFAKPLALHKATCRAVDLFDHAMSDLRSVPLGRIVIEKKITPVDLRLDVDPQLMREVTANLVTNAVEAMGSEGSILVSFTAGERGRVILTVDDDGPGMPESMRDRPIQPFVTTKAQGTGLGLSICRKIVEEHGGTLSFSRRIPRGTVVTVDLPGSRAK